jgi:hypothetical protein
MGRVIAAFLTMACLTGATVPLEARGLGHHLKALLARAAHAVRSLEKHYTAEFLTVPQLAERIKRAKKLDEHRDQLESDGAVFSSQSQVDQSSSAKDKWDKFNTTLGMHNNEVNVFNIECSKQYYADDLALAQKLAQSD